MAITIYGTIPHDTSTSRQWVITHPGDDTDCIHRHVKEVTWFVGSGGTLMEMECIDCRRRLREEFTYRSTRWPLADRREEIRSND